MIYLCAWLDVVETPMSGEQSLGYPSDSSSAPR